MKLCLFTNDFIVYIENPMESMGKATATNK